MKTKLIAILITIIIVSCHNAPDKKDFYGIWESFEQHHEKTVLTFYQDSLILDAYSGGFHTNSQWSYDEEKIYLKNIREADSIIIDTLTYKYKFNKQKDTLTIKLLNHKPTNYSILKKVKTNPFRYNWQKPLPSIN